jgi:hypothetical protein
MAREKTRSSVLAFLFLPLPSFLFSLSFTACATQREDLARGQRAFEQSSHERALAVFRSMEPDVSRLDVTERARYAYLRGMTDYRMGYRPDARHWLAIAKAIDEEIPGSLPADWKARIAETMGELNAQVYEGGIGSLANVTTQMESGAIRSTSKKAKPASGTERIEP